MLAIADSQGYITATYAGSGYDQAAWLGAGLTSRAQTYQSRRWEASADWGGVQQFRHRAYDPGTGTWIQEDPLGVAGGVNVYQYNNGNPVTFSDPMGMCPEDAGGDGKTDRYDDCPVGSSGYYAYLAVQGDRSRVNDIKGIVAACAESTVCSITAIAGTAVVGAGSKTIADAAVSASRFAVRWLNQGDLASI
ncbi:MAG TPA: RHS repeat-associated core domain-containing protein [Gemmatimonadales bacterium]|nr:RHS repeat-associated core domain-containing protein [Gemmatimonadales bacterium]